MTHPYTSFWHQTAEFNNSSKENIDKKEFDILIVGAGLSGLNTAFLLMNKGYKIGIIDASNIGYGTSGYTTAKISIQHNLIYDYLIRNCGFDIAKEYYAANTDGLSLYRDIIGDNNIDCDFTEEDSILYTTDINKIYDLKNEYDAYEKFNINCELKENFNLPFPIAAGLIIKNQYQFNPLKYIYSIAKILIDNNVQIYENVRAIDIVCDSKPYDIVTDKGHVYADKIVITSHYPFDSTLKMFFLKLSAEKSYIIACKTNVKKFDGMYLNIDKNIRSLRYQKYKDEDILLVGGCNHKVGAIKDERACYRDLEDYLIKYFSKYEVIAKWSTQDCMTHDKIPYIGSLNKNENGIYVATGYNKWGMTTSAAAAIIIRDSILHNAISYNNIFSPKRHVNINLNSLKEIGEASSNTIVGFSKRFLIYSKHNLKMLEKGNGIIISHNLTKLGVYLDDNETYHCIKPICTHLGCEVKFNNIEKTWDCRCHGSRFDIFGNIIEGPATIPLKYCCIKNEDIFNE